MEHFQVNISFNVLVPCVTQFDCYVEEFGIYLQYVRKLGFEETPDYDFLRELFDKVLERQSEHDDSLYDWVLLNEGKGWEVKIIVNVGYT